MIKTEFTEKYSKFKADNDSTVISLEQEYQNKIFNLTSAHDQAQIESAHLFEQKIETIKKEYENQVNELKQECESQRNEIKRLHQKIEEIEYDLRSKQSEIDALNLEIKSNLLQLKSEQENARETKESYEKSIIQMKSAIDDKLKQSVDQKQTLESRFTEEIAEKSQTILELNSQINNFKINFECEQNKFEKEKLMLKEEIKQLKKQCENDKYTYQSKIYELKTKYENEENESKSKLESKHIEDIINLQQKFDTKISLLQDEIAQLNSKNIEYIQTQKKCSNDSEYKINNLKEENYSLKQTNKILEESLEDKNKENEDLNNTIGEYEYEIDQLKQTIKSLNAQQQKLFESQESIATINEKYDKKIDSINKITNMLEKEVFTGKLDITKYDHKTMFTQLTEGINSTFDEELCKPVEELLSLIASKGAPKVSNFDRSLKPPLSKQRLDIENSKTNFITHK